MDDSLGNDDIVRSGYLDVFTVAFDEGDVEAESFNYRGIVRKAVVVRLSVSCF